MKVYLAADHGGFDMKNALVDYLKEKYDVEDLGPSEMDPEDDYPEFAFKLAEKVAKDGSEIGQKNSFGILICRSAGGIIIAANKVKGIRAIPVYDEKQVHHARDNNDANVIGLSGDWTDLEDAKKMADQFLETPYSGVERHSRRIKQISDFEQ